MKNALYWIFWFFLKNERKNSQLISYKKVHNFTIGAIFSAFQVQKLKMSNNYKFVASLSVSFIDLVENDY